MSPAFRRPTNKLVVLAALLLVVGQAGAALLNPLAYTSNGDLDIGIGNAVTINTTTGEFRVNGILAFTATIDNQQGAADPLAGAPELAVFSFDNINIGPGVAVTITGDRGLSLLSRGDVTIRSALSVNGGDFGAASVAGGYAGSTNGFWIGARRRTAFDDRQLLRRGWGRLRRRGRARRRLQR